MTYLEIYFYYYYYFFFFEDMNFTKIKIESLHVKYWNRPFPPHKYVKFCFQVYSYLLHKLYKSFVK